MPPTAGRAVRGIGATLQDDRAMKKVHFTFFSL